jgi:subtilase family serine protease
MLRKNSMRRMRPLSLLALTSSLFSFCALLCRTAALAQSAAPAVQIVAQIDENNLVTLRGDTHPAANARNDRGPVSPDLPMTDLIVVLSRDPAQQAAFDKFVASQYDPDSPNFHQWLTPEQVGDGFGPSQTDIGAISNWLTGHGFSIGEIPRNRMSIRFSGSAAQVESAFHTEIHNLEVKGVAHIGNMSDPRIPAALTPAVVGVKSLHNFFPRPLHRMGSKVSRDSATGKWQRVANPSPPSAIDSAAGSATARPAETRPQFGINVPASGSSSAYLVEDVSPYDFATIYNILPLWNASKPIDGTGETIAIAGTSDIDLSDVTTFRSTFGLPAYTSANQPTVVSGNGQPLTVCPDPNYYCTIDDLIENSLDVEWAGSIAKGANINLVSSYPASQSDDGLYDSESYIVGSSPLIAHIMNVSYGLCELGNGTSGNVEYYNLWETAASEGIAVFVAAGDAGSASCDDGGDQGGNPYSAQYGLSVNGLASTVYDTAVGGTDFNWCSLTATACTAAPYWKSTNAANGLSAIGYVPEVPWNDTCANPLTVAFLEGWATSSYANNVGGVTDPESGCNFVYNNWQTVQNNTGGSGDGVNLSYLVDTIGGSGGASGCVVNDGADVSTCVSTTTTTGPAFGSLKLVADGWPKPTWQTGVTGIPSDGVRDLPDVSFFASDGFLSSSSYLICVSSVAACTYTTSAEPFAQEVGGTSVASPAMAGVMALIDQKTGAAQGSPNAELYKLAAKQSYTSCSAEKASITDGCYFNDIDTDTNAMPCDYGATEGDPSVPGIQSPNCTPVHTGDLIGILSGFNAGVGFDLATGLGSLNVANVVNGYSTTTAAGTATVTVTPASTTVSATSALNVAVTVASTSSGGVTPTGNVTLSGGGYTSSAETLAAGAYTFAIPANSLSAGSDTLSVSYSGDSNFAPATSTASITVTGSTSSETFTVAATAPAAVAPGTSGSSTITVTATGNYAGTATLACALTTSPSGAVDEPTCSISPTTVVLSSTNTSGTVTATIATTAATTSQLMRPRRRPNDGTWLGAGSAVLAFVVFLGIPARRRTWRRMLSAIAALAALSVLSACGDFWEAPSGNSAAGTTTGTYTFTVTGTGSPAVTAVTTTFSLTVN